MASKAVLHVCPTTLFGQIVPGLFNVENANRVMALVKPKTKTTVRVLDGDINDLGLTHQAVRRAIGKLMN